jgi:purine-nucleoside phosphorylase
LRRLAPAREYPPVTPYADIQEATESIRRISPISPVVGVVLGSGLGAFAERVEGRKVLPYRRIPHFPVSGVAGHAGELVLGSLGGVPCAVMSGRVHYYEGYDLVQVTFPVRVLASLGARVLLVTNAAGAVNPDYEAGSFMVIADHLNLTGQNPLRGHNDDRLGPRFPDLSDAYPAAGRAALHEAARAVGVSMREGVYAGLAGPSYETPAEVRMLQRLGADAVGMSTVNETIIARHAGLTVAGLSVITNRAAGLSPTPLSHDDVKAVAQRVQVKLVDILAHAVAGLAAALGHASPAP